MKKRLGLDLGVASIGWSLIEQDDEENSKRIIDLGSFCFNELEDGKSGKLDNVNRRMKRCSRRLRRRKVYRLKETRNIFIKHNLIKDDEELFNISDANKENILSLKVKGLNNKLTKEELCLVLYNYMKYRGFKSSRKVDDQNSDGVLLKKINEVKTKLNDKSISEYLYDEFNKLDYKEKRYHNHEKEYKLTVDRSSYRDEIVKLLDKQISYGVVDNSLKEDYLNRYDFQRDFSQGPDGRSSKYGSDWNGESLIEKMRGKCVFDGKPKACKDSFSAKSFILLSSLANLRIKTFLNNDYLADCDNGYKKLSVDAINKVYNSTIFDKQITYNKIFKLLNIDVAKIIVKGLCLSRSEDKKIFISFVKDKSISSDLKYIERDDSLKEEFKNKKNKKMFDKNIVKIDDISYQIKDEMSNHGCFNSDKCGEYIDIISDCLFRIKTDKQLEDELIKNKLPDYLIDVVKNIKGCSGTIDLSLDLCKKVIPYLKNGIRYDEAMKELGYDHSLRNSRSVDENGEVFERIPCVEQALKDNKIELKNPVVKNTLVKMIKLINAIIKKYGKPDSYSIEFARELRKTFEERKKIRNEQLENMNNNNTLKLEILENYSDIFSSFYDIKKDDLIKYKLFKEQNGKSAYTDKRINDHDLFDKGKYEVDHIIPYSRCFDDSLNNKVLVEREENQNKKNRTPIEYFKYIKRDVNILKIFIKENNLSDTKEENLLKENVEVGFSSQDLNSSAYIARLTKQIISYYLLLEEDGSKIDDSKIIVLSGSITDKLKQYYGLKGLTHSFASDKNYKNKKIEYLNNVIYEKEILTFTYYISDKANNDYNSVECKCEYKFKKVLNSGDSNKKELSEEDKLFNEKIKIFNENLSDFNNILSNLKLSNSELIKKIEKSNCLDNVKDVFLFFIGLNITKCQSEITKKDRDNDLHHALDASVIATVTRKTINNITSFYGVREKSDEFDGKNIPLPYKEFKDELVLKVYERDIDVLRNSLLKLDNYKRLENDPNILNEIHVLYPVRLPKKVKATALSKETIYGKKTYKNGEEMITQRISVKDLKTKDIENIVNINHGNDEIIKVIKDWMKSKDKSWPVLVKKTKDGKDVSNYIKTVKINKNKNEKDLVKLGEKKYAENDSFLLTRIYKNKKDHKLYGVGISYYHLINEKKGNLVNYKLMCGQGEKNSLYVNSTNLNSDFVLLAEFNRYSLLRIVFDKKEVLCYGGGFTSGMLEIYSILGDNYDVTKSIQRSQITLTISTIKDIKVKNISILGYIS